MGREGNIKHSDKPAKKGFSLRMNMLLYFGLLFVLIITALVCVEFFGVPFMSYKGIYGIWQSRAFDNLNLVADLKKERLERSKSEKMIWG